MNNPYQVPEANLANGGMVDCVGCAKELHSTASMCPHCGATQRAGRYKNKTTAALLALLLGAFGAHRFYLGQWWGVFYLLFFWAWIPGLIAFVEFIIFLVRDQRQWDDKYNEGKPAAPGEGSGGGTAIALVVGGFIFIAFIGMLAAVALPAYQDYTERAKASQSTLNINP